MSATIFRYEFRARLKSVLIWSLSVAAILFLIMAIYPSFADEAELMRSMLAKMPPALLEAFGMNRINMADLLGFFSFVYLFVQLCLAIQAGNYGFGLVSVEESELTADFLLTKPVSRTQVLTSKLLAAVTCLTLTNLVVWIMSFVSLTTFNAGRTYTASTLLLVLVSNILFQLFFLSVGLVVSLLVKRVRSVTPYSLGLAFGMYVLSAFSGVFNEVALEYLSAFKHIDPTYIVQKAAFNTPLVLLNAAVTLVSLAVSYWLYIRRDIHAVS